MLISAQWFFYWSIKNKKFFFSENENIFFFQINFDKKINYDNTSENP